MFQSIIRDPGGDSLVRIVSDIQPVNGSKLIVPADTTAFFVYNGIISEPYPPGCHTLKTHVSPFFVRLRHIMTRGEPDLSVSVFFVATALETEMPMGTGEFIFREKRYRISMKALAAFSMRYKISDPEVFLHRMVGMHQSAFTKEDIDPAFRAMVLPHVRENLGAHISSRDINELHTNAVSIGRRLTETLRPILGEYGIGLISLSVIGINIPEGEMQRLYNLENSEASGHVQTDNERYHMEQVYGNLSNRTMVEALTGIARTGSQDNARQPSAASELAGLPMQMAMIQQIMEMMRHNAQSFAASSDIFSSGATTPQSPTPTQSPQGNVPPPRPSREPSGTPPPISRSSSTACPHCGAPNQKSHTACKICGRQIK